MIVSIKKNFFQKSTKKEIIFAYFLEPSIAEYSQEATL